MKTATKVVARLDAQDEGEWLQRLLADIQREIAEQPSPGAVARMRGRVLAVIGRPERAAA
jgi:hypothetical protein